MPGRLALLALLGALSACDAPPPVKAPAPPAAEHKVAAEAPSRERIVELSGQCERTSRERFRRDWKDGTVPTPDGKMAAEFTTHYNAKLETCFYFLTVTRYRNGEGSASASTISRMVYDADYDELYGEYSGPTAGDSPMARLPTVCRVESMYCASIGEWEVLVRPYAED